MNFFSLNTLWIFISGDDEDRFIDDIRFGLAVLKSKGIDEENIKIFIDGEQNLIHARFGNELGNNQVLCLSALEEELKTKSYKNVVLFTTGHGSEFGLAGNNPISPYKLLKIIRLIPEIERGLFVIGQCYAGIFNHIDAKPTKGSSEAEICILGSAGFSPSLSSSGSLEEKLPKKLIDLYGLKKWTANVFLFYFFLWLYEPQDIDGNGELTVMDAYKFVAIKTSEHINNEKKMWTFSSVFKIQQFKDRVSEMLDENEKILYLQEIDSILELLHIYQEPFICNSRFAQELKFEIS